MKALRIWLCVLTAISILAFAGSLYYTLVYLDKEPPVFSVDEDALVVKSDATDEELLKGVTATDDRDGDLTDQITIAGVSRLGESNHGMVGYMVFDSADNYAAVSRDVYFSDYSAPRFVLMEQLSYGVNETVALKGRLLAKDAAEGNITPNIRISTLNLNNQYEGVYHISLWVVNKLGDTASITLPIIIQNETPSSPHIDLTDYLIYLPQGTVFLPERYFEAAYATSLNRFSMAFEDITVEGEVDPDTPGTYEVTYSYVNGNGEATRAILTVVVEPKGEA